MSLDETVDNKTTNFYKKLPIILFLSVIVVGLAIALYLYDLEPYSLYFYGDAVAHAHSARAYFDSEHPGFFEHLGTVWLPLPHLLLTLLTMIDPLFRSGFAGLIVSLPSHAITCLILFKLIQRHTNHPLIPLAGSSLYAFNPNILYLSITPMTEAPFMLFFVFSAYYFQKWMFDSTIFFSRKENDNIASAQINEVLESSSSTGTRNLIISGAFISLATLCRYEGWIICFVLIILVLSYSLITWKRRQGSIKKTYIFVLAVFLIVSLSGIIFWVIWNWEQYGNPLEFATSPIYSAAGQALVGGNRALLYLQPLNVFNVYGKTTLYIFGPALIGGSIVGLFSSTVLSKDKDRNKRILLYILLIAAPVFTIISMIQGVGEMNLTRWFNSRFLIIAAPLIVLLNSMFLDYILKRTKNLKKKPKNVILLAIIAILFIYPTISPLFTVVAFDDALSQYYYEPRIDQISVGKFLQSAYDGDTKIYLITTGGQESNIALESGFPLKSFNVIRDTDSNSLRFLNPWLYTNYLVLSKEPKPENNFVANYWINNQDILQKYYHKIYENGNFMIFSTHANAVGCIQYDSPRTTIIVSCKSANLTDVYNSLKNLPFPTNSTGESSANQAAQILNEESPKIWFLNSNLEIANGSTFYINSSDTAWLKINSTAGTAHNITTHGNLLVDKAKITSWDSKINSYANTNTNGTVPRSYILTKDGNGNTNITNSEIAHLGYNHPGGFGLTFYTGSGSMIKNSKIHNLFSGFYSQNKVHDIAIQNNEIYNNTEYGIDPYGGTHDLIIKQNSISDNGKHGIICSIWCYHIIFEANKIYDNKEEGILFYKNISNSIIKNNVFSNNRDQIAIYDNSNNNTIYKNEIHGGKVGVRVTANSSHNLMKDNNINGTNFGIYILNNASNNVVDSNRIVNTTDTGILIQDSETNGNVFKNNLLLDSQKNDINRINQNANQSLFINNTIGSSVKQGDLINAQ